MTSDPVRGVFIGLLSLDVLTITEFPIPRNKKFRSLPVKLDTGGPAANSARAFDRLGGQTQFVTVSGDTAEADILWSIFEKENPAIKMFREPGTGDPKIANVLICNQTGERTILANGEPKATGVRALTDIRQPVDIALTDGYHFTELRPVLETLKAKGTYIVLDGGSWKDDVDASIQLIDCAVLSNDFKVPSGEHPARYLQNKGVETVIITDGENPVEVFTGDKNWTVAPPQTKAIDTLGAGDMFHGAFCFYYAKHRDLDRAVRAAAEFASRSVTEFGLRAFFESIEI